MNWLRDWEKKERNQPLNVSTHVSDCQDAFPLNTCTCNFSSGKYANSSGKLMQKADEKVWVVTRQGTILVGEQQFSQSPDATEINLSFGKISPLALVLTLPLTL